MNATALDSRPNSSFQDGIQFAWDSTSLKLAMECPRKYYYSMIRQIAPRERSVHLLFGGLYASALEHFYKHRALGDDIDTALLKVVQEAMVSSWDSEANAPVPFLDNKKTRFNLIRTIVWYVDTFAEETESSIQTYHLSDGKPAVELSFTLDLDEDFVLCGHLDRVVDYGGSLFVMDQKTTGGTIGPYFFSQFDMDTQMSMYAFAGQVVLKSPVAGVIIDGAQIAVGSSRFERGFTYRSPEQLEEFLANTKHVIHQMQSYTSLRVFPMNTTACGNYGGCPYKGLCSAAPRHREKIIAVEYAEKVWDPLERR